MIYSDRRSADEVILQRVKPGDRVVTADRDLAVRCRGRRARALDPREFLGGLKPASRGAPGEKPPETGVDVDEWMEYFGR